METYTYRGATSERLDRVLDALCTSQSRTQCKRLILASCVTVNGQIALKPGMQIEPGATIGVTPLPEREGGALAEPPGDLGVRIVYEHKDFVVVNKPAGLVVHAPFKHSDEVTLVDWLVHADLQLSAIDHDRPGIVHRLDKDTSGLLIVAKHDEAHRTLAQLFQDRAIEKTYLAFVKGHPDKQGTIDLPIGRNRHQRHKMAVCKLGKAAVTNFEVLTYYEDTTMLALHPQTGRTHQLRVHCATQGHALLGDATYGSTHTQIKRHALHAYRLGFWYEGVRHAITCDMPADLKDLQARLVPFSTL